MCDEWITGKERGKQNEAIRKIDDVCDDVKQHLSCFREAMK